MNRLNEYMIGRGISQKDVAAAVGVSRPTVSDWVNNKKDPRGINLQRLAGFLGVPWQELIITKEAEPAPVSSAAGWNVEYPTGVAQHTQPQPVAPAPSLSDADIARIAERVAQMNRDAKTSPILTMPEQQLIEEYRLLNQAQKIRVQRLIGSFLDRKYNED